MMTQCIVFPPNRVCNTTKEKVDSVFVVGIYCDDKKREKKSKQSIR